MGPEAIKMPKMVDHFRRTPALLLVTGAAALSLMSFDGLNGADASAAGPIGSTPDLTPKLAGDISEGPTATAAFDKYDSKDAALCWKVFGKNSVCEWGINPKGGKRSLPGTIKSKLKVCASWSESNAGGSASCSFTKSESKTVKASVTGTAQFPWGTLSTAAGYDLQKTTTLSTERTAPAPKGTSGEILYRLVYDNRREVKQELKECQTSGGYGKYKCYFAYPPKPEAVQVMETAEYDHLDWVVHRKK